MDAIIFVVKVLLMRSRAQIDRELQRLCIGTDAELARLNRIYAGNKAVQQSLDDYEVNIETGN
ncbi:hypothetical protein ACK9YZ_27450 [Rhizobium sp. ZK1]|uniref:hypothetical protein n=1 Tax=Rhizobium sp. ZK1 TaxID=3389872 RepID=UPI0039F691FE